MKTSFFVNRDENVRIVIDRALNENWIETSKEKVPYELSKRGNVWHEEIVEDRKRLESSDEAILFVFEKDELIDGEARVLTVKNSSDVDFDNDLVVEL